MTPSAPLETPNFAPSRWRSAGSWSTATRLFVSFSLVLALFGVALAVCLGSVSRMGDAELEVERVERARQAGTRASILLREQYIHQAHTIITWDHSHLAHYEEVAKAARAAADALASVTSSPAEAELAARIAQLVRRSDEDFRSTTVPAVDHDDRARARELHEGMEALVHEVGKTIKELNGLLDARAAAARARASDLRWRAHAYALGCFIAAALVAAVVCIASGRTLVNRVGALRDGVARLGRGDLGARIVLGGRDEFAELASSFNDMASDLAQRQAELVRTQKLASIGQLAAGVAHEINNPLGVILGYTRLLRRDGANLDESLRAIEEETLQAQRIVEALLDLARPLVLNLTHVDLAALAAACLARHEASGSTPGVTLRGPTAARPVFALGDEAHLRQVLANLVSNAADAAAPDGVVEVTLSAKNGRAALTVDDSGRGIPEADMGRIFEPFFTTKAKGVGLGLAIAQAAVVAHRGELHFERAPLGGARAVLLLPLAGGEASST